MNIPASAIAIGSAKGKAAQRQQYLDRLKIRLQRALVPLADRIPLDELLPIAAQIHLAAYETGYQVGYGNRAREARMVVHGGRR